MLGIYMADYLAALAARAGVELPDFQYAALQQAHARSLERYATRAKIDPDRYVVGEEENSVNPKTGARDRREFENLEFAMLVE